MLGKASPLKWFWYVETLAKHGLQIDKSDARPVVFYSFVTRSVGNPNWILDGIDWYAHYQKNKSIVGYINS